MRTLLLIAVCGLLLYAFEVQSQTRAYTLAIGRITGDSTTEADACYFPIGQAAMLALHPNGEPCKIARGLIGQSGMLVFVPDP